MAIRQDQMRDALLGFERNLDRHLGTDFAATDTAATDFAATDTAATDTAAMRSALHDALGEESQE